MPVRKRFVWAVVAIVTLLAPVLAAPTGAKAGEGTVALAGVRLWVVDTGGDGTPIVLLHANSGTSAIWEKQIAAFAQAGYRVIAFDRRGWGRSVADPATGPQPGSVAGDLEMLVEHLKLPPFHLLGVAGGGFVALDYAASRPQRLRSLVIGGSTGAIRDGEVGDMVKRIEIEALRKQPTFYLEVGPSYRAADPEGTHRWREIEEHARQPGAPSQPLTTLNTLAKVATIATPTLVIAGDADLLAPPALMRSWARQLRSHEWAVIPDAGHAMSWEQPGAFDDKVLEFVRRY